MIIIEGANNSQKDWDDFWYNSKEVPVESIRKELKDQKVVDIRAWRTLHNY
tara:strand:+ start:9891 stop:10043 length:153 start_codon:yes stop_codon:yes gene_type:complete